jgi:hypothetical protein
MYILSTANSHIRIGPILYLMVNIRYSLRQIIDERKGFINTITPVKKTILKHRQLFQHVFWIKLILI